MSLCPTPTAVSAKWVVYCGVYAAKGLELLHPREDNIDPRLVLAVSPLCAK
jgi:hypothetical protein